MNKIMFILKQFDFQNVPKFSDYFDVKLLDLNIFFIDELHITFFSQYNIT